MNIKLHNIKSSVIISVYTDHIALKLILDSFKNQTCNNFEIIISEDGISDHIKQCVDAFQHHTLKLQHLSQKDFGFRKNIALNRAIMAANSDHLIFIDGDCIPHPSFVEAHQSFAKSRFVCTGRRLELGDNFSKKLRDNKISLSRLSNRFLYILNMVPLLLDKAKNIESGIYSKTLHMLTGNKRTKILGCNFSCSKNDLLKINGFNQDYLAAGTGEDSDIDWRLNALGTSFKNVKFSAIQYHLHHPKQYTTSTKNRKIYEETKRLNQYVCKNGIQKMP